MGKVLITQEVLDEFQNSDNESQLFIWDSLVNGFGIRKIKKGKVSFIFQCRIDKKSVRTAIRSNEKMTLDHARSKAKIMLDEHETNKKVSSVTEKSPFWKSEIVKKVKLSDGDVFLISMNIMEKLQPMLLNLIYEQLKSENLDVA